MKTFSTITLIVVALIGLSAPSFAEEPSIEINFRNLDLSKTEDVTVLYKRIQRAARLVCRDVSSPWDGRTVRNFNLCYNSAVDTAIKGVNHYALTAIHEERDERLAGN